MDISVVIPLYNKAEFIERAIRSVLSQSHSAAEIIVVDDGSTDDGAKLVSMFSDQGVRLISQANQGVSAARNRGVDAAKSEFIAFLDADDYWHQDFLSVIASLNSQYPEAKLLCTGYEFKTDTGLRVAKNHHLNQQNGVMEDYFLACCNADLPITSSSVCVSKASLQQVGGFNQQLKLGEDQAVWARIACQRPIAYSKSVSVVYDLTASTVGHSPVDFEQPSPHIFEFQKLLDEKIVPKHLVSSVKYLQHLTVMSSIKSNLLMGKRTQAFKLLISHPLLKWDRYRAAAFLLLLLPKSWVARSYMALKERR
ncbi:glycosyltransferase family 2 protein [Pseudoalteromonas sp. T1lg65]|uniref:glycosyltransferase family 2 protein n=1 Tax=Pseudoalteromonas sp. T1lg65 TaxID=2077101 RepID=UPI003F79B37D